MNCHFIKYDLAIRKVIFFSSKNNDINIYHQLRCYCFLHIILEHLKLGLQNNSRYFPLPKNAKIELVCWGVRNSIDDKGLIARSLVFNVAKKD